jgi:hypothetical protein
VIRKSVFATLMFVCLPINAAVFGFESRPAAPTDRDVITATFGVSTVCDLDQETVVIGNVVRTTVTHSSCFPGPPPSIVDVTATFGPLPAGTYTYEVYEVYEDSGGPPELTFTTTIVAAAAAVPVPALDGAALGMFAFIVAAVALIALRRGGLG